MPSARLIAPANFDSARISNAEVLHDYGSFVLIRAPAGAAAVAAEQFQSEGVHLLHDPDWIFLDAHPFNTQQAISGLTPTTMELSEAHSLQLIQFVGPIKQEWLQQVTDAGATPIHYVANFGYLVWAGPSARSNLAVLAADGRTLQFSGRYSSQFKFGPTLEQRLDKGADPDAIIPVTIQVYSHAQIGETKQAIEALSVNRLVDWSPILAYENARFEVRVGDLQQIAQRPDVYWLGEYLPRELLDEVQNQIVAGDFNGDMSGPAAPGYLAFLSGLGFPTDPAQYPVVDIVDDGIGTGSVNSTDPTLHVSGSVANPTRLLFVDSCTANPSGESLGGHGHINTSIVGGFDDRAGFPFQDPNGYQRGQGVNPYARMGGTRIFSPGFDLSACGGTDTGLIKDTQDAGAQISSNSWGCSGCAGTYDDSSQAFDVGVRDADLVEAGNQELLHIFAAGNSGPGGGTVGTPSNGKNMLTVGASENQRPMDEDGNWSDGCGVGPTGADDAMDVIGFSSRGPSPGNRVKPETIAPGTHIQGTASTSPGYNGGSVCDQFRPSGQTDFAASSGTSHSTPAVAGLTSLVWWWIENNTNILDATARAVSNPTPALLKAYVINHPTYLTGVSANDTLPSNVQGYGMPNMMTLFDDTLKYVVNQTVLFDNSGETWQFIGSAADPAKPVRIMMVYTDQAGAIGTSPQVNDLNLSVETNGDTYLGNVFSGQWSMTGGAADSLNNYEAVFLPAGTASDITITVTGFNIAGDGVPNSGDATDQDFALVCYNCAQDPTFTLSATPGSQAICTPDDAVYQLDIGTILGFNTPVTLSTSGEPAGTTAGFSMNPVTPPGMSTLTIGNTGAAAAGNYTVTVQGIAGAENKTRDLNLDVFTQAAGTPALSMPNNGELNVALQPTLEWTMGVQAAEYLVEVATDSGFGNIVYSSMATGTSHVVASPLMSNTQYFWRVTAMNICGLNASTTRSFSTVALPGDCAMGSSAATHFFDDLEGGAAGWTHSADQGPDTWALSSANPHSGSMAWNAEDLAEISDQRLVSPSVVVPASAPALTLQFWNHQVIEDSAPDQCWDGALVEVSTDGGTNWTQLEDARMQTDPYDGPVRDFMSGQNPLVGLDAWCGDPQEYLRSVVDLSGFEGQTLNFRFRLGSDGTVGRPEGWTIDDVKVQSCVADQIYSDGFENP